MSDETSAAPEAARESAPSIVDLQAEVAAAREELVASITELKSQTQPKALAARAGNNVKGFFTDQYGGIRPDRVAVVGAVVAGIVVLGLMRRRRR
jgi:F0F1-type ATP synthase membrane subunit b/b'